MKNKKMLIVVVALVAVVALMLGISQANKPETVEGAKEYAVTVVHKDGSAKDFTYRTDAEFLADALVAEGLIAGEEGPYGLTLITADGEEVVWERDNAYWQIFMDGEAAVVGVSQIPVYDGSNYSLEYTSLG